MQDIATTFQQFILALVAMLAHPQTPKAARSIFQAAAVELAEALRAWANGFRKSIAPGWVHIGIASERQVE